MSKQGHELASSSSRAKCPESAPLTTPPDTGPLLCDIDGSRLAAPDTREETRKLLMRLAKEVMGWYTFEDLDADFIVNQEEIEKHAPCALEDQQLPVLLVYEHILPVDVDHSDGKLEKVIYGRYWNPLNEIHDAWQLLEAMQEKGTTILLEPSVFGVDAPTASRVICHTILSALDEQKKVII